MKLSGQPRVIILKSLHMRVILLLSFSLATNMMGILVSLVLLMLCKLLLLILLAQLMFALHVLHLLPQLILQTLDHT